VDGMNGGMHCIDWGGGGGLMGVGVC